MHTHKVFRRFLLAIVILTVSAGTAFPLDIGLDGWLGNLGFVSTRKAADTTFPGEDYFWGLSLYGTQSISDAISLETGFYSDQVLRNTSYTLFSYKTDFLTVGFGPFFGLFNDDTWGTIMKSGISTSVRIEVPGVVFVSFRSDSSIGGELVKTGDYQQYRNDVSCGVYLPNAICTLSLNSRSFEQLVSSTVVVDSLAEYAFSTDIYKKNVPYRVIVTIAYQSLSRSFITAKTTTATLNSVILGTEVDLAISPSLIAKVGIEGNVYSFGQDTLVGGCDTFLFRTFAGVKLSVDSIPILSQIL
jgi:hypothetical protein